MTIKKNYQGTFIKGKGFKTQVQKTNLPNDMIIQKLNPKSKKILEKICGGGFQKIE